MSQKQELGKGLNALLSNINKNQASVIKPQGTSEAISQDSLIQLMPLHDQSESKSTSKSIRRRKN